MKIPLKDKTSLKRCPDAGLLQDVDAIFRQVYGRPPTRTEHTYRHSRIAMGDKRTSAEHIGAMYWHFDKQ